jgi:cobalamin biosynthesis protein CobD/CbiB
MVTRLRQVFFHPVFLAGVAIYVLIRLLRKNDYPLPHWINGHLTDLICLPIVLMICLAVVRVLKRNSFIEIKPGLIALICLEYALIFEWILPQKSRIYTADWIDVVMYFLGGLIFFFIQPIFRKEKKTNN